MNEITTGGIVTPKRKFWLDNIRWMAVLLVLLFHVVFIYNTYSAKGAIRPFADVQYQDVVLYLLNPWLITALAVFLGSPLLYEVLRRIPVIRWCLFGAKKQNK